ncbi:MAG: glycosyltransferase, partial [Desulfovibrionaceae bacterium]
MTGPWRIAWVGNEFFRPHLTQLGHQAVRLPVPREGTYTWPEICARAGFEPDLVVYADVSRPPVLVGVEDFPCLTAFYCIDSHLHAWYPFWAQAFDLVALSLKDHLWRFRARLTEDRLLWLPPAPQDRHQPNPGVEPEWDLLFAGNVSQATTPKRWTFLHALAERVPGLVVRKGRFEGLFPRARLVLNFADKGDLNFRVFEALACRACLLTPRVGHGLEDLFTDGEHLFLYDPDRPDTLDRLARLAQGLLAAPARRDRVAEAGWR